MDECRKAFEELYDDSESDWEIFKNGWLAASWNAHLLANARESRESVLREALERLTVHVNGITAYWRHQHRVNAIPGRKLDGLYEVQLEAEKALATVGKEG